MIEKVSGRKLFIGYMGLFMMLIGVILLVPLIMIIFYQEDYIYAKDFILPGISSIFVGFFLYLLIFKKEKGNLKKGSDIALVLTIWLLAILISSIPFMLTGKFNFTQAVFETTSAYTTTGLSVVDVSVTPHIFLFYRSFMLFVGGIGLVLILTSATSDSRSMNIYLIEGHNDKLLPNLIKSSRLIFSIYFGYMILGVCLYLLAGMDLFDAVNHSMSALSTGGFSTNPASIGGYNNIWIEMVTVLLMILGSTNFIIHYYLMRRKFKEAFIHFEFEVSGILLCVVLPLLVLSFVRSGYDLLTSCRYGVFEFFSALTTTGFQIIPDYSKTSGTTQIIIIILMIVGGQCGSTSGGIKQGRIGLAFKGILNYLSIKNKTEHVISTKYYNKFGNKEILTNDAVNSSFVYILLYLSLLVVGSFIISFGGYDFGDSFFEMTSALGTVGLSVGITSYNTAPYVLWTLAVGMFLGRIEIVIVFEFFMNSFKIKKRGIVKKYDKENT
jgi:Trk-type K+ transport systems, membrane components